MTDIPDRIKLAEAMGWTKHEGNGGPVGIYDYWMNPEGETEGMTTFTGPAFRPFTDANDDYAVLEWMRGKPELILILPAKFTEVVKERLDDTNIWNYCVGDYARAALKVLK